MFTTKTKNGTEVRVESLATGFVRLTMEHPQLGTCAMLSDSWGTRKGVSGATGPFEATKGGESKRHADACVTIPREDFDRALAEAKRLRDEEVAREVEAVRSGAVPITLIYHDGEYLSGYGVHGPAAELLVELGLAKPVEGWGYHVDSAAVKAMGESFTYALAAAHAAPAIAKAKADDEAKVAARAAKVAAARDEARRTGGKVVLSRWYSHDTGEGSVFVTESVDADGKITTTEWEE